MVKLLVLACLLLALCTHVHGFIPSSPVGTWARIPLRNAPSVREGSANLLQSWRGRASLRNPRYHGTLVRMSEDEASETGFSDEALKGLMKRVAETRSKIGELPLVVLDSMLPRQRLSFGTADPGFRAMIQYVKKQNEGEVDKTGALGSFAMVGVDPMRRTSMEYGTEVELVSALDDGKGRVDVEIVGRRRFMLVGEPWMEEELFYVSKVEWIEGEDDEETDDMNKEVNDKIQGIVGSVDKEANVEMARELEPLVEQWKKLVVEGGRERQPDQISLVLQHLGPMPAAERPRERALWVAALINPLPALGVAMEIRPAILEAKSTAEALTVALSGIKGSIGHLDGSEPLW